MPKNLKNLLGLVAGFALGQGSVLIAYSVLISSRQLTLVTYAGIAIAGFSLAQQVADYGGFILLTRVSARSSKRRYYSRFMAQFFSALVIVRLTAVAIVTAALSVTWFTFGLSSIVLWSSISIIPGMTAWAFNRQGQIDAIGYSGVAGMLNAIPWMTSAIALMLIRDSDPMNIGIILGLSYSTGLVMVALAHSHFLTRKSQSTSMCWPKLQIVKQVASSSTSILLAWLPGQLLARAQLGLSVKLPLTLSSAFVYARNVVNAANSLQFMINRIEFPKVVKELSIQGNVNVKHILFMHSRSLVLSVIMFSCLGLAPALFSLPLDMGHFKSFQAAALMGLTLSPLLLTTAVNAALSQSVHALGRSRLLMIHNYLSLGFGFGLSYYLVSPLGALGLVMGSIVSAAIQFAGCTIIINRRSNGARSSLGCLPAKKLRR